MRVLGLQRGKLIEQRVGVDAGCRFHRRHTRLADGERARLVEDDEIHLLRAFQRLRVGNQDAAPRARTRAGHDGGRRGKTQRTWAGNYQHGNSVDDGRLPRRTGNEPTCQRENRRHQHRRHENGADAVDQLLDRRLGSLRVFHKADDAREHRVGADGRGAHEQHAVGGDGAGGHVVAFALGHGQAFAGQHGFIDVACAFQHHRIHGDAFTGAHGHHVADAHLGDRGIAQRAVGTAHASGVGTQRLQRTDGLGGLALGTHFQPLAKPHQRDDHGGAFEVQVRRMMHPVRPGAPPEPQRQPVRRRRAERDQQIHIAGTRTERLPAGLVEACANHELHRRCQQPLHPGRQHPVGTEPPGNHGQYKRHRQCSGNAHRAGAFPEVGFGSSGRSGFISSDAGLIAGRGNSGDQRIACRAALHAGPLGREIHARFGHAGHGTQGTFDTARTGSARHPTDIEIGRKHVGKAGCSHESVRSEEMASA